MSIFSAPKWDVDEQSENLAKKVLGANVSSKNKKKNKIKIKKQQDKNKGQFNTSQSVTSEAKPKSNPPVGGLKKKLKPKEVKKSVVKISNPANSNVGPLNGSNEPLSKSQRRKRQRLLKRQQELSNTSSTDVGPSNASSVSPKKGKKMKKKQNIAENAVDSRSKLEKLFEVEKKRKRVKKIKEALNDKPSLLKISSPSLSPSASGSNKKLKNKLKKEEKKKKKAEALALANEKLNKQEVVLNKKKKMKMLKIAKKVSQDKLHTPDDAQGTANPSFDTSMTESVISNKEGSSKKMNKNKEEKEKRSSDSVDGNFISTFKKYKLGSKIKKKNLLPDNSVSEMVADRIPKKKLSVSKLLQKAQSLDSSISSPVQKKGRKNKTLTLDSNISHDVKKTRKLGREVALEGSSSFSPKTKKEKQGPTSLREKMVEQLKSARFRWLNEQLYCSNSWDALKYFKEDPDAYEAYHSGYRNQVAQWPVNPVEVIIKAISSLPRESVVADFGCGDAHLAASLPDRKVHSLDLIAGKPGVIACDMAHTPLLMESVDVAVFCLSLMGTNLNDFILEANRVLKTGGMLYIAEVESRFEDVDNFTSAMVHFGFTLKKKDISHQMFIFMDFKKAKKVTKSGKMPALTLEPCIYKRR